MPIFSKVPYAWNIIFPENPAPPGSLLLLHQALYGLKGSARAWQHHLNQVFSEYNLIQSLHDASMFIGDKIEVLVHSDDIIISAKTVSDYDAFATFLSRDGGASGGGDCWAVREQCGTHRAGRTATGEEQLVLQGCDGQIWRPP